MAATGARDRVVVVQADYGSSAREIGRIFDELLPPVDGKTVLLKPNMVVAWPKERGATTHPAIVRACVEEIARRGGRPLVGDQPGSGTLGRSRHVARACGILEAAGESFVDLGSEVVERTLGEVGEVVPVSRLALEADVVVSLPKLKTHVLTTMSCGVKNSYGLIVGAAKSRLHKAAREPVSFSTAVVDICSLRPPDLVLVDGIVAMQGNGPTTSDVRTVGKLVASRSPWAVDLVCARIMGLGADDVPSIAIAVRRGLCPADVAGLEVQGDAEPVRGFRLPLTFGLKRLTGLGSAVASSTFFSSMWNAKLALRAERCTGCGSCIRACPVSALTMVERKPRLDRDSCISCFCCMEGCTEEAWEFSGWQRALGGFGRLASQQVAAAGDRLAHLFSRRS